MSDVTTRKSALVRPEKDDPTPSPFDSISVVPGGRKSAVEMVIDTIERLILEKRLRPGDRLPSEFELTQSLSTSRGSIREAIRSSPPSAYWRFRRGDGTYVSRSLSHRLFDRLIFQ